MTYSDKLRKLRFLDQELDKNLPALTEARLLAEYHNLKEELSKVNLDAVKALALIGRRPEELTPGELRVVERYMADGQARITADIVGGIQKGREDVFGHGRGHRHIASADDLDQAARLQGKPTFSEQIAQEAKYQAVANATGTEAVGGNTPTERKELAREADRLAGEFIVRHKWHPGRLTLAQKQAVREHVDKSMGTVASNSPKERIKLSNDPGYAYPPVEENEE